jgi:hypothetical protein
VFPLDSSATKSKIIYIVKIHEDKNEFKVRVRHNVNCVVKVRHRFKVNDFVAVVTSDDPAEGKL